MSIAKEISGLYWTLKQHVDIQTDKDVHVSEGGGETEVQRKRMLAVAACCTIVAGNFCGITKTTELTKGSDKLSRRGH